MVTPSTSDSSIASPRQNADCLVREIEWFAQVANARLNSYFPPPSPAENVPPPIISTTEPESWLGRLFSERTAPGSPARAALPPASASTLGANLSPPDLSQDTSIYAQLVRHYQSTTDERLVLILALLPHVQPHLLDIFFSVNKATGRGYTEFGGLKGSRHGGFLPTLETALFLIAGNDLAYRFQLYALFEPDHYFFAHHILQPDALSGYEPLYSSPLTVSDEYVEYVTMGKVRPPQFSTEFPAKRLTTDMAWQDLVVDDYTARQLDEIRIWLKHGPALMNAWEMHKKLKPGYKALFYGPPGTGKTLTAALLGKLNQLEVYRIDLSMVISKYIGETEKNLEKVFKKAEKKNWILFFDEADALFGKRTNISDAHDKYANQEISYLLQRLEDYTGLVILASNMRQNVDEAFSRRLQSIIHFPKPQVRERLQLWKGAFSSASSLAEDVKLEQVAQQYELAGGSIINVVQYASLMSLNRNETEIRMSDLLQGIRKEFQKEGKSL